MPTTEPKVPTPKTRAPKAWHDLASYALVTLPKQMSRTQQTRRRLRRVRPR